MVAIIKSGYSLRRSFFYNENKLERVVIDKNGQEIPAARLLSAVNYPMELSAMSQPHRLNMLLKTAELNPDMKRHSVHISLNFAPGEVISPEKIKAIAQEYMEAIGFGRQPYLVYEHHDSGHPHLHIVTTNVQPGGQAIRMYNIGKLRSEPARKAIEKHHGLVAADSHKRAFFRLRPIPVEKVMYGKTETKNAIANILSHVLDRYKYTSLPELNAVLNLYGVHADAGSENSRIRKNKGLQYRLLDGRGNPVGTPIKASHIYTGATMDKPAGAAGKAILRHKTPTLNYLEKNFRKNKLLRVEHAASLKLAIDSVLKKASTISPQTFNASLKRMGIHVEQRRNAQGRLYGMTYVDHRNRCVFNGSDLGKNYSANALHERFMKARPQAMGWKIAGHPVTPAPSAANVFSPDYLHAFWQALTEPIYDGGGYVPYPLRPKRRKKRRNRSANS